jgi:transposase
MLDLYTRTAILRLSQQGHGLRPISKALGLSRNAVRDVVRSGQAEVPSLEREEHLSASLPLVRALYDDCGGNLVRVAEKLADVGIEVGYSTLTSFCRRHEIGTAPKQAAGVYSFAPGEEMQHDTSPHTVTIAAKPVAAHCASLVMCYSRDLYAQLYRRWSRFECRLFMSEAISHFGGAAGRCVVDNSSVVLAHGTGKEAVAAPEMQALAQRFGFSYMAHELGDKNRSGRVERPFHYIEHNFYPGRTFESLDDLNEQLRAWCETVRRRPKRHLPNTPAELFAAEKPALRPLPLHVPEVYDLHPRRVGVEGYVQLHTNRYPVPDVLIGRQLQLHETARKVRVFDGHKLVIEYDKQPYGANVRVPPLAGQHRRGLRTKVPAPSHQEQVLRGVDPTVGRLIDSLKKRDGGRAMKSVRRLYRMYLDYPTQALVHVVQQVERYGLLDLARIEKLVLTHIAGEFFRLPIDDEPIDDNKEKTS